MLWNPIHEANIFREASAANCTIFEMENNDLPTRRAGEEYGDAAKKLLKLQ